MNDLSHGTVAEAHCTVIQEYKTEVKKRKERNKLPREIEPKNFSSVILLRDYLQIKRPDTEVLLTTNPEVFPDNREYLKQMGALVKLYE